MGVFNGGIEGLGGIFCWSDYSYNIVINVVIKSGGVG